MNRRTDPRVETDRLGDVHIPAGAYWGARTARARDAFTISGRKPHSRLVNAIVLIKKAAALASAESGRLDQQVARAVCQAADEVLSGLWRDQFIVDPFQSGAGTAHNNNVNEVLSNRALEILGHPPGSYAIIHPDRHVNLAQSANDVFPTAMRISILSAVKELEPVVLDLERLLRRKSLEFDKVLKAGRTHLQDAAPISLGQEFNAYGSTVERSSRRIKDATNQLLEVNLGATTTGTGIDADPAWVSRVVEMLSQSSGFRLRAGEDYFRLTQSAADFLEVSSSLKEFAVELAKISSDLRLLCSGPQAGLAEINLPPVFTEPASLLPGVLPDRAHPVMAECLAMVAFQVIGNDTVVTLAAQAGQLDLNVMTPVIIHNLLESLDLFRNAIAAFNQRCVSGITANATRCRDLLDSTGTGAIALISHIGYDKVVELVGDSLKAGVSVRELVLAQGLMTPEALDRVLLQKSLTQPGLVPGTTGSTGTA